MGNEPAETGANPLFDNSISRVVGREPGAQLRERSGGAVPDVARRRCDLLTHPASDPSQPIPRHVAPAHAAIRIEEVHEPGSQEETGDESPVWFHGCLRGLFQYARKCDIGRAYRR
jgi:hypothetical protein